MVEDCSKSNGGLIAWAVFILLIGLLLFVIWIIVYQNRTSLDIPVEWYIWIFLGIGLFMMIVGIIWLIILLYSASTKKKSCCQHHHEGMPGQFLNEPAMGGLLSQQQGQYIIGAGVSSSKPS